MRGKAFVDMNVEYTSKPEEGSRRFLNFFDALYILLLM
jgi:hypothetical protein